MAEITKATGLDAFLEENKFDFGRVDWKDKVTFSFPYKGDPNYIHYIEPGCGCTSAYYNEETNSIEGELTIERAVNKDSAAIGINPISKISTVMLDPSQHYLIPGAKKEKKINNEKPFIRLYLTGTVFKE